MAVILQVKNKRGKNNKLLLLYRVVVEQERSLDMLERWKAFQEFSAELGGIPIMGTVSIIGNDDYFDYY